MTERHVSTAIALATSLFNLREQFIAALRAAALERIESIEEEDAYARHAIIHRRTLELHVDDALYAIGRDGVGGLEYNVRHAVDEIVRETLDDARGGLLRSSEIVIDKQSR
jgi:hypothetical protein